MRFLRLRRLPGLSLWACFVCCLIFKERRGKGGGERERERDHHHTNIRLKNTNITRFKSDSSLSRQAGSLCDTVISGGKDNRLHCGQPKKIKTSFKLTNFL